MRTPWALLLECPFSYLHVQAVKVVAENGKPLPGHLLSRLSQCSPSVRQGTDVLESGIGMGLGLDGKGLELSQAVAHLWFKKKHKLGT